ncbi:hypothetical protein Tco_0573506 [Tanacetum coccineum]
MGKVVVVSAEVTGGSGGGVAARWGRGEDMDGDGWWRGDSSKVVARLGYGVDVVMVAMMSEMMDGVVGSLAGDGRRRRKNWPESKGAPEKYLEGGSIYVCVGLG